MAGPKRVPYKNKHELKLQYRWEYLMYFLGGCWLSWPIAMAVGRRAQTSAGGVAVYPVQRWIHNWPNTHPMRSTWRMFRRYVVYTLVIGGTFVA